MAFSLSRHLWKPIPNLNLSGFLESAKRRLKPIVLFQAKPVDQAICDIHLVCLAGSLILAISSFFGVVLADGYIAAVPFLGFCCVLRYKLRSWVEPGWLCFQVWSLFYIEIPCLWYALAGGKLDAGFGLISEGVMIGENHFSQALFFLALFPLTFLILKKIKLRPIQPRALVKSLNDSAYKKIFWLCFLILLVQFLREKYFMSIRNDRPPGLGNEILRFFFHDTAIFFGLCLLNLTRLSSRNAVRVSFNYMLIVLLYVIYFVGSGSKGAIFSAIFACFIAPIACAPILGFQRVILPKKTTLVGLAGASIPFFWLGLYIRNLSTQKSTGFGNPAGAWKQTLEMISDFGGLAESILYRLSAEFSRYLLLATDYFQNGIHPMRFEFFRYIGKNMMNLVLPGTPFPESYFPSSTQMPELLARNPLQSGDYFALAAQMNSQPFTIFGLMIIGAGLWAPALFFGYGFFTRKLLITGSPFWRVGLVIFFLSALSMYGLEDTVWRSLMFVFNIFLLALLARWLVRSGRQKIHLGTRF